MTKPITDFWFKKIGKMIEAEDNDGDYELPERNAPYLQDLGFVEFKRWTHGVGKLFKSDICNFCVSFSGYFTTEKGRQAYKDWKNASTT